jgi:hypothetical protein
VVAVHCGSGIKPAQAAESATGFYLLGSKTSMAGFIPPPGTYVSNASYYYSGSSDVELNIGGIDLTGGIDADAYINMPTALWVAPGKVWGGYVALSTTAVIGWKDVSAGATLSGPGGGSVSVNIQDDATHFGDPVLGAALGWHEGNWHWNIGALLNVPIGYWEKGDITNIGFNRWAGDVTGAVTWLDMKSGVELSGAAGFTFNAENPDTDYKTGTEFHLEAAAVQNFSKSFGIGINGYFYDQVTGDSGAGARLGAFEGRVAALGPVVNWNFEIGKVPVSASFKYFHEFDVKNRLEGDSGFFTLTMPLSVSGH